MLTPRLYLRRATRTLRRGGFTLVELLVVIGIIAILAGVALGPITNGIKKAKQSSGVQEAHALGLAMYSAANDNSQLYPDSTSASTGAQDVARALLAGSYVSDPGIFWISGDTASGSVKYSGTTAAATTITVSNVSWDFLGNAGSGASSVNYVSMPLIWSTVHAGTEPTLTGGANTSVTAVPTTANPFQQDGIVVFYINNNSTFVPSPGTAFTATILTQAANNSGGGANYVANQGL